MKLRNLVTMLLTLVVLAGGGFGLWRMTSARAAESVPTAVVRKGDFFVTVQCRGELRARNTRQIVAPLNVPDLRIVWMVPAGSRLKVGDAVVRFDPSSAKQQLQEKEAQLQQMEAQLKQAEAEARLQTEDDRRDLSEAGHQVERAKIEVVKSELESRLKGEEAAVDLGVSEQKKTVQQAKLKFNEASSSAKIASIRRQRDKAEADVAITKRRLERMEVKAPLSGMVNYLQNFSQGWMNAKPFKVGDQVWPGSVIGEIPDLKTIEMEGKIEEIDRGQMTVGQDVRVRIDSLPETTFPAKLDQLSPLTEMGFEWPPTRSFKGYASIAKDDERLRPGMNGRMDVVLRKLPGALSVPSKAIFTRGGKPVVYVQRGGSYVPVNVEVEARNPDETAIKGVAEGDRVTLAEPALVS
jgi:multidrug efflux pump subunit AcrA (membrane-fusion protein)